jgi:acyl carrier protein
MSQDTASKRETLKEILNDILAEKEGVSQVDALSEDISLTNDLGLDSLDLAEMTVRLEDKYGIDVYEKDIVDEVHEVLDKLDQ